MELHFGGSRRLIGKKAIRMPDGSRVGTIEYPYGAGGIYVLDGDGYVLYRGCLKGLPERWTVFDAREELVGTLSRNSPMSRTIFEYDAGERGYYDIEEDRELRGYRIEGRREAAFVGRQKRWSRSDEYRLVTEEGVEGAVSGYEWVAVMQGLETLRRRTFRLLGVAFDALP